jgi:hypothetical protein
VHDNYGSGSLSSDCPVSDRDYCRFSWLIFAITILKIFSGVAYIVTYLRFLPAFIFTVKNGSLEEEVPLLAPRWHRCTDPHLILRLVEQ